MSDKLKCPRGESCQVKGCGFHSNLPWLKGSPTPSAAAQAAVGIRDAIERYTEVRANPHIDNEVEYILARLEAGAYARGVKYERFRSKSTKEAIATLKETEKRGYERGLADARLSSKDAQLAAAVAEARKTEREEILLRIDQEGAFAPIEARDGLNMARGIIRRGVTLPAQGATNEKL